MFSPTATLVVAVGFLSVGKGLNAESKAAYEAIAKCLSNGYDADAYDMRAKGGRTDSSQKVEEACIFMRVRLGHV